MCTGTGKTFVALYNALKDVLNLNHLENEYILFAHYYQLETFLISMRAQVVSLSSAISKHDTIYVSTRIRR